MKYAFGIVIAMLVFVATTKANEEMDKLLEQAADSVDQFAKKITDSTGFPTGFDKKKIENILKEHVGKPIDSLNQLLMSIKINGNKPFEDFKNTFDGVTIHFNEALKKLNSFEGQSKLKKIQDTVQSSLKDISEQLKGLGKSIGVAPSPGLEKAVKETYEEIVKGVQNSAVILQNGAGEILKDAMQRKKSA